MKNVWYKINVKTKEHTILASGEHPILDSRYRVVEADADGWIEWNGGECPLPDGHKCDARDADGSQHENKTIGKDNDVDRLFWEWDECNDHDNNIIAYRPILDQPASEEVKGWDGEGLPPLGTVCELSSACQFFSLQRGEVIEKQEGEKVVVVGHAARNDNGNVCITIQPINDASCGFATGNDQRMVRPTRAEREQWVEKAKRSFENNTDTTCEFEAIYDALASGELDAPGVNK